MARDLHLERPRRILRENSPAIRAQAFQLGWTARRRGLGTGVQGWREASAPARRRFHDAVVDGRAAAADC